MKRLIAIICAVALVGCASNEPVVYQTCREFFFTETRNGRAYNQRGVRCEKLDGSWEILNVNGYFK